MIIEFSKYKEDPQIGDFVLAGRSRSSALKFDMYDEYIKFINSNIGTIYDIVNNYGRKIIIVKYDNMPKEINDWLDVHGSRDDLVDYNQKNLERYQISEVTIGKTIEELEMIIQANKYNI